MTVLIFGDTVRTPELRHEVPLGIPDPFVYAEIDGRRIVVIGAMEAARVDALDTSLEVRTTEEFGADEVRRSGLGRRGAADELAVRIVRGLGIERAHVPRSFPLGLADALRSSGIHGLVSRFFADRGFPTLLTKPEGEVLLDGFYHGLGHGVGLEVHEAPGLGMNGDELIAGDVITIEPGLYRQGIGGVRVEDLLYVTKDGYELMTDCPYELEVST